MSVFTESLEELFSLCHLLDTYENDGTKRPRASENIVTKAKNSYQNVFRHPNTKEQKFIETFKDVYNQCTEHLLNPTESLDDFMTWFENSKLIVSVSDRSYIRLSLYFKKSCMIARAVHKRLNENDATDSACNFPEHFCLHLIRIFHSMCTNVDQRTKLEDHLEFIEKELNIEAGENPSTDDFMDGLVNIAGSLSSKMGLPPPKNDDGSPVTGNELKSALNNVMSNPAIMNMLNSPQTQEMMQSVMSSMGGSDGNFDFSKLGNIVSGMASTMRENADSVPEAVARSIEATSDKVEEIE